MRSLYREEPCRVALNRVRGMEFNWSLNPYMGCAHRCTFCYVRAFEERADRPGDARYGDVVRVKTNVVEVLRQELARPSWPRESVAVGAATDPYQPAEGRYRLTRGCIGAFAEHRTPFDLITRGTMILRDLDVLVEAARRARIAIHFSVPTLDPEVWRRTEPGTANPRQRLRVLTRLVEAGIAAGVAMAPILPGISDRPEQLAAVVRAARDAGATHLWSGWLHMKGATRAYFLEHLAREWPAELERYQRLYGSRAYLGAAEGRALREQIAALKRRYPLRGRAGLIAPPAEPVQLMLSI